VRTDDESDFIATFLGHLARVVGYTEHRTYVMHTAKRLLVRAIDGSRDPETAWRHVMQLVATIVETHEPTPDAVRSAAYLRAFLAENEDLFSAWSAEHVSAGLAR
jgi:hypothetical protein